MKEYLLKNFELYFPATFSKTISYKIVDELVYAELNDGTIVRYDDLRNSIKTVKRIDMDLTEQQSRIELSRRIYNRMRRMGMTQYELAAMTGLSEVTISKYMNGKTSPTYFSLSKIAKALKCTLDDLVYID